MAPVLKGKRICSSDIAVIIALLPIWVTSLSMPRASLLKPYCTAPIDYSAANEYVDEHYGTLAGRNPYFPHNYSNEPVYDARIGYIQPQTGRLIKPSLQDSGFELLEASTTVSDWENKEQWRSVYLPELRKLFAEQFGSENIQHLEFFHPMLRGERMSIRSTSESNKSNLLPTSPPAASAHIDNDVGAFEPEQIISLVEKNCLEYVQESEDKFPRRALIDAIRNGHRFLIVNCWRNVGTAPVQRVPLGLYAVHYRAITDAFPAASPDFHNSRWYFFPEMTKEECLFFKQYDRDARCRSDLWHCALQSIDPEDAPPRESLDLRAFVVLREKVANENDRYSSNRMRPILTLEESADFCQAQGEARQQWKSKNDVSS